MLSRLPPRLQTSHWRQNQSFSTFFAQLLYPKQAFDRDDRAKAALPFAVVCHGRILPRAHSYLSAWWNTVLHIKLKLPSRYLKNKKKNQSLIKHTFYNMLDTAKSAQQEKKKNALALAPSTPPFCDPHGDGCKSSVFSHTYAHIHMSTRELGYIFS